MFSSGAFISTRLIKSNTELSSWIVYVLHILIIWILGQLHRRIALIVVRWLCPAYIYGVRRWIYYRFGISIVQRMSMDFISFLAIFIDRKATQPNFNQITEFGLWYFNEDVGIVVESDPHAVHANFLWVGEHLIALLLSVLAHVQHPLLAFLYFLLQVLAGHVVWSLS